MYFQSKISPWKRIRSQNTIRQESILVGCIPPAADSDHQVLARPRESPQVNMSPGFAASLGFTTRGLGLGP